MGVPAFADYREMLTTVRPNGAVLGTINSEKAEAIVACIEAGVHVMVDKPLCTEFEQLKAITHTITEKPVRLNMVYSGGHGGTHAPHRR